MLLRLQFRKSFLEATNSWTEQALINEKFFLFFVAFSGTFFSSLTRASSLSIAKFTPDSSTKIQSFVGNSRMGDQNSTR